LSTPVPPIHVRKLDVESQITSKESKNTKAVSNDSTAEIKKKNDELRDEAKASDKEKTLKMKLKKGLAKKNKYYASLKEHPTGSTESKSDQLKKLEKEAKVEAKKLRQLNQQIEDTLAHRPRRLNKQIITKADNEREKTQRLQNKEDLEEKKAYYAKFKESKTGITMGKSEHMKEAAKRTSDGKTTKPVPALRRTTKSSSYSMQPIRIPTNSLRKAMLLKISSMSSNDINKITPEFYRKLGRKNRVLSSMKRPSLVRKSLINELSNTSANDIKNSFEMSVTNNSNELAGEPRRLGDYEDLMSLSSMERVLKIKRQNLEFGNKNVNIHSQEKRRARSFTGDSKLVTFKIKESRNLASNFSFTDYMNIQDSEDENRRLAKNETGLNKIDLIDNVVIRHLSPETLLNEPNVNAEKEKNKNAR